MREKTCSIEAKRKSEAFQKGGFRETKDWLPAAQLSTAGMAATIPAFSPFSPGLEDRQFQSDDSPGLGRASRKKVEAAEGSNNGGLGNFYNWLEDLSRWLRETVPTGRLFPLYPRPLVS